MLLRAVRVPLLMSLVCATLVFQACGLSLGQDAADKKTTTEAAKKRAEPKGRLPAYFGEVVTMEQRDKIYGIQGKYTAQLKKLQDELDAVVSLRDQEVEGVLTPEQKEKVSKLQNDAKLKRAAAAKKKADDLKAAAKPVAVEVKK